jgi:hypothetical protein
MCGLCYIGPGMTTFDDLPAAPLPQSAVRAGRFSRAVRVLLTRPVAAFFVLSLAFGGLTVAITPPLEGPDEPAHFLRAYGISVGEIIPSTADAHGRKGIFVPPRLHWGYGVFERALFKVGKAKDFNYREVWTEYFRGPPASTDPAGPVFQLYWGSRVPPTSNSSARCC